MSPQVHQLLAMLIPLVVAIITVPLFNLLKRASAVVNGWPDPLKQLVVMVVAAAVNWLTVLIGMTPPVNPTGVDQTALGAMLSALLAYLLHLASQMSTVKATQASVAARVGAAPPPKGAP